MMIKLINSFVRTTYSFSNAQPCYGGGDLGNLLAKKKEDKEILFERGINGFPLQLTERNCCDLELIMNGGFSPLKTFMNEKDYNSVVSDGRLDDGTLFTIPIYLDINEETLEALKGHESISMLGTNQEFLGVMEIDDVYLADRGSEEHSYGGDPDHAEIIYIRRNIGKYNITGNITGYQYPLHDRVTENDYRKEPEELRKFFESQNWSKIVAFQTRNPIHNAHIELTSRASRKLNSNLLLSPVSGPTMPGDVPYGTRMKCYKSVLVSNFPQRTTCLNIIPLAMRMGGPREAVLHSIIRKNYGATHFIVGRDHAGPGKNSQGIDIYEPFEARDFVKSHEEELGINIVGFEEIVFVEEYNSFFPSNQIPVGKKIMNISGTELRRRLSEGDEIPSWFSPCDVINILRHSCSNERVFDVSKAKEMESQNPKDIMKQALEFYGDSCAVSFSGAEDVYLIELAHQTGLPFRVFSLDTGRLHPETYEYFNAVEEHYGIRIEYCFPESEDVECLVQKKGMFSFMDDGHKECCTIRKVNPLKNKLSTLRAWITGIREDQSVTRGVTGVLPVEIDQAFKGESGGLLIKFNPLAKMSSDDVWEEIKRYNVPFNQLHNVGFKSIGCAPCTRPTNPSQHEREGRWWWEGDSNKECGLHLSSEQNVDSMRCNNEISLISKEYSGVKE